MACLASSHWVYSLKAAASWSRLQCWGALLQDSSLKLRRLRIQFEDLGLRIVGFELRGLSSSELNESVEQNRLTAVRRKQRSANRGISILYRRNLAL